MSIYEYDEELHMKTLHEEGVEEGIEKGEDRMKLAMKYRYEQGCNTVEKLVEKGIPQEVAIKALS